MPVPVSVREQGVVVPTASAEPLGGMIVDVIVSMVSIAVLTAFLTRRVSAIKEWNKLPLVVWLVFAIFVDSWLFVFVTAILKQGVGLNSSFNVCSAGIIVCLCAYLSSKILIYLFLVEKAFVVRNGTKSRLKSKLYIFNSFGMLSVYAVVAIMNFIYRITRLENGVCVIGMKKISMIPLISFDLLVNIYLTTLFLIPLRCLYSFKDMPQTSCNARLRAIAIRTFFGACATTVSSVVNLTVLMSLNGEPGWVCLLCCNCDILFSAIVIQWVTTRDNAATRTTAIDEGSDNQYRHNSRDTGTSSRRRDTLNGIKRVVSTTQKFVTLEEADVSSYPMQPTGAFKSTDGLSGAERGHARAESLSDASTAGLVETTEVIPREGILGVSTVIVAGKDMKRT
ncbi:hypothetical protein BJ166DRAFT_350269 [Pestalotiopsis sp. NC0098]|nr:hypothetical protein BJ166DRAFT_350269 [Pestalotiopsis sp. NC0098]